MRDHQFCLTLLILSTAIPAVGQPAPSQRELNGFLLGQYKPILTKHFGKPYRVQFTDDRWEQRIYILSRRLNAYMVFEFAPAAPDTIYAIQISGEKGTHMLPFYGVKIGDTREAVIRRFGVPSDTTPLADIGGELLSYRDRNYSFEINEYGILTSIRIMGYTGFPIASDTTIATQQFLGSGGNVELGRLALALSSGNIDTVIGFLMPDVEVYAGTNALAKFTRPARQELLDKTSAIHKRLFGSSGSLKHALQHETSPRSIVLRIRDDGIAYPVVSYPKGRYLQEVVFRFHAGRWRVWEIRLK